MENKRASGARRSASGETKRPHPRSPDSLQERGAAQLLRSPQAVQDEARRRSPSSGSPGPVWAHWEMQVPGGSPGPAASPPGAIPHRGAKVQEKKLLKRWGNFAGGFPPRCGAWLGPGMAPMRPLWFWALGCAASGGDNSRRPPGEGEAAGRALGRADNGRVLRPGLGAALGWPSRARCHCHGPLALLVAEWGRARCLHPEPGVEPPPPAALPRANSIKEAEVARLIFLSRVIFFF